MHKQIFHLKLNFFFLLCLPVLTLADETLTITTYYPSPYGSYNEMRANKMVIGDVDSSTTVSPSQGAVTFKPASTPTAYSEGTLYYDNSTHNFKYRDNSTWQTMGGVSFTYYCFSNSNLGSPACTNAGGTRGYCPSGYTQKVALGSWGYCSCSGCLCGTGDCNGVVAAFLPPGGSCGAQHTTRIIGDAYVCSQ